MKKQSPRTEFDAVIVGAGMAGLGAALALSARGKKVLVVGRKQLRGESSPAAGGILDPLLEMHPSSPLLPLTLEAYRRWPAQARRLERRTGIRTGYKRLGMLYLAYDRRESRALQERQSWHRRTGVPLHPLPAKKIIQWIPSVSRRFRSSLFYPSIARVQPPLLLKACKALLRKQGGRIFLSGGSQIVLNHGRVAGVRAGNRLFSSGTVINATGSWAGVNRQLGTRPRVLPARGQILIFKNRRLKIPTILHSLDGGYIVPWENGRYLTGSTVEKAGFVPKVTPAGIRKIRGRIERLVPGLRGLEPVDQWAGLRPYSADHFPWIGPTRIRGLYLACGYFRVGLLISFLAGELLAEAIITGRMPKILKPFSPECRSKKRRR